MPFKSDAQRRAVYAKLNAEGFKTRKVRRYGKYFRARQEPPSHFQKGSFRTIDPGRKGHMKLVIGRPKGSRKTRVQSVIVEAGE